MNHIIIALIVVLIGLLSYLCSYKNEFFVDPNIINPGFGEKLGKLENQITDPLDPKLWDAITKRVALYPGGFSDVVMTLQDRNQIPSINNLSV
jgi:hypothetical protein